MNKKQYMERYQLTDSDFKEAKNSIRKILLSELQKVNEKIEEMAKMVQSFQKTDQYKKQKIYKKMRIAQSERRLLKQVRKIVWHMHLSKTGCELQDD